MVGKHVPKRHGTDTGLNWTRVLNSHAFQCDYPQPTNCNPQCLCAVNSPLKSTSCSELQLVNSVQYMWCEQGPTNLRTPLLWPSVCSIWLRRARRRHRRQLSVVDADASDEQRRCAVAETDKRCGRCSPSPTGCPQPDLAAAVHNIQQMNRIYSRSKWIHSRTLGPWLQKMVSVRRNSMPV